MSGRLMRVATAVIGVGLVSLGCTPGGDHVSVAMGADQRFDPPVVEIPVGGTVTWRNDGAGPHTVTSITRERDPSGEFDSDEVTGTGTFSHTFEEAGSYLYQCMLHSHREMVGVVEVVS